MIGKEGKISTQKESDFLFDEKVGAFLLSACRAYVKDTDMGALFANPQAGLITGAADVQKVFLFAAMERMGTTVLIVPEEKDILRWEEDLRFFIPSVEIYTFPVIEETEFQIDFRSTERLRERIRTLSVVMEERPAIVIVSAKEIIRKIPRRTFLEEGAVFLSMATDLERETLLLDLVKAGYERTEQVERSGHFALRGDILDIFCINHAHPVRIEFFGDEVDAIRYFDEDTQRSIRSVESVTVMPVVHREDGDATLLSYLENGTIVYDEPGRCEEQIKQFLREERSNKGKVFSWSEVIHSGRKGRKHRNRERVFSLLKRETDHFSFGAMATWKGQKATNYQRQIPLFMAELTQLLARGQEVIITIPRPSEKREIEAFLQDYKIPCSSEVQPGYVTVVNQVLSGGFEVGEMGLSLFTAGDILGKQKARRYRKGPKGKAIRYFSDLKPGDYVVQQVHGIGRYIGVNTIELDGIHRDYITIQYAGSDKLHLPMEQIVTLEKYIGPEGQTPTLHKMGGVQWERVRSKVRGSIEELAEKLLAIYAKREVAKGIAFAPDSAEQNEFEDTFPYVETPDQLVAIEAVKEAMERPSPMDMLVCGDVGFGKTEVAMRAVFKCVMSGYQAMVLCPTTVLSRQHGHTFEERMAPFGVNVAVLNRFTSLKERNALLAKWSRGELDVIIGTHALLSKKVKSSKLGLLVVDEEQRFGVVQKEKWKSLVSGLDVITLSATPIPRTLHMSLTGVRDMVTMAQAPENRHAIQTYVTEYDDAIVKDAVLREKERGGQVYFVYNRIETIYTMEDYLRKLLPKDISIGVAHGRMDGKTLDGTMTDFFDGKYDILLCTTLIENGLDHPNANTMLVYDADRMGLSQIYQMRGRVGRSEKIGRAYFFYRKGKVLTEVAEKRLDTIREFTELGSGFKIAMRDLEIRGAGNLLGSAQHGNIATVGFATYCSMLEDAVQALKDKKDGRTPQRKPFTTAVEFRQDAYLGADYIESEEQRMDIYRRLAIVSSEEELRDLIDEVIDRFGTPDTSAEKLFFIAKIRLSAHALGIGSIMDEGESILLTWADETPMRRWNIAQLPKRYLPVLHFLPGTPARVRMKKALIQGNLLKYIWELTEELRNEIQGESFA